MFVGCYRSFLIENAILMILITCYGSEKVISDPVPKTATELGIVFVLFVNPRTKHDINVR